MINPMVKKWNKYTLLSQYRSAIESLEIRKQLLEDTEDIELRIKEMEKEILSRII